MKTLLRRSGPLATLMALATLAAACDGPVGPPATDDEFEDEPPIGWSASETSVFEGAFHTKAVITCNVIVATATVTCTSPQDPDPLAQPTIGGFGMHARLLPSNAAYNSGTSIFRIDMRVVNLLSHTIGTESGTTTGVRAFFHEAPVTTNGTGVVTVANAFGTDEFTATNQPYFYYGQRLSTLVQSVIKQWQFNVPSTVNRFRFRIHLSANILPMIVFEMEAGTGNRDIYRVNIDGTGLLRLTSNSRIDMYPTVARDNVVFASNRSGNFELYSMPLAGGSQTRLTFTPWNETQPALAPNGASLAFISDQTGVQRVWYSEPNGVNPQQAAWFGHAATVESHPTWMTNTSRIVFASSMPGATDLYRVNLPDNSVIPALPTAVRRVEPKFNHDRSLMAYVQIPPADPDRTDIWFYDFGAATATRLTSRVQPDIQPTFVHDDRLVWVQGTASGWRLRWRTLDGSQEQTIPLPGPAWNPFGVPLW
jgi:hypothetical protein